MRSRYDEQLNFLNISLIEMGALIEHAISNAVKALINKDSALAQSVIDGDDVIDEKEKDIESLCLKLLLNQQPVAKDLRVVSAALKLITDMERIGDHAADISSICLELSDQTYMSLLEKIPQMADATMRMLKDAIDAFVRRDRELAESVIGYDDVVDDLFRTVKADTISSIRDDSEIGEQAIDLLQIAKYFERIGDHATNIAEWVIFTITGVYKNTRML